METRALRKTRTGVVVKNGMDKSITIAIVRKVAHPIYKKYLKKHQEQQTTLIFPVVPY